MRKLFSVTINEKYVHVALLILRITTVAFMLTHGWPKLSRLLANDMKFGDPLGIGVGASLTLVVFAEFFCSILVGIGLGTRLATIPLIIAMSVAAFISNAGNPFGRKELALMYLLIFVILLLTGGGKYSIDGLISKSFKRRPK